MKLDNAESARLADKETIEKYIPGLLLMERAASNVWGETKKQYGNIEGKKILIVCGTGNNGGDGFACARYFASEAEVELMLVGSREKIAGDAKINFDICRRKGYEFVEKIEDKYDIIIDAVFGTGLTRDIDSDTIEIFRKINACRAYKVAVDIPSGVSADNGQILGNAVKADLTVTFTNGKIGHFIYPGKEYTGKLAVVDIGIDNNAAAAKYTAVDKHEVQLKEINRIINKSDAGKVLVIGGSTGMAGAPYMAAEGALRAGAGLVTLAVPKSIHGIAAAKCTEIMTLPLSENEDGTISLKAITEIMDHISKREPDVVVIGPGMGRNINTLTVVKKLVESIKCIKVVDADGLFAVKDEPLFLKNKECILTPHKGEFERMYKVTNDKCRDAKIFAEKTGTILVYKGADTVTTDGEKVYINTTGNPGLATGGSGDVLAGVIASFVAQGYGKAAAAYIGAYIHGMAADELLSENSVEGIVPTELIKQIGKTIGNIRKTCKKG